MSKNILYTNGKFYIEGSVYADSVFCCDGKVEAILNQIEADGYRAKADEVIDLGGKFVYPDFANMIEDLEYDHEEVGLNMLSLYDSRMAQRVRDGKINKFINVDEEANWAVYELDLIRFTDQQKSPPAKIIVRDGEVFFDEEVYEEEQYFWMMASQQF